MVLIFFNVYLIFEGERDRVWVGEGQRETHTQIPKQAPGSELSAQSLMWGSILWTMRSWSEPKSRVGTLNRLSHPGAPPYDFLSFFPVAYFIVRLHYIGAPGWLSWLSIRLWLESWSRGLWVWAPHWACCCQHRAHFRSSVPFSHCPSPACSL